MRQQEHQLADLISNRVQTGNRGIHNLPDKLPHGIEIRALENPVVLFKTEIDQHFRMVDAADTDPIEVERVVRIADERPAIVHPCHKRIPRLNGLSIENSLSAANEMHPGGSPVDQSDNRLVGRSVFLSGKMNVDRISFLLAQVAAHHVLIVSVAGHTQQILPPFTPDVGICPFVFAVIVNHAHRHTPPRVCIYHTTIGTVLQ